MKDVTLWVGWYGMLVTLHLVIAGWLVKDRMKSVARQLVRGHRP